MRRLLVALIATAVTACTPAQVAAFKTLTPAQQRKVVDALQERPRDCYSAVDRIWPASSRAWARQIVWRESRNQPAAQNPRSSAAGCFGIIRGTWLANEACPWPQRYDPGCNTATALRLYRVAGASPWA